MNALGKRNRLAGSPKSDDDNTAIQGGQASTRTRDQRIMRKAGPESDSAQGSCPDSGAMYNTGDNALPSLPWGAGFIFGVLSVLSPLDRYPLLVGGYFLLAHGDTAVDKVGSFVGYFYFGLGLVGFLFF